MWAEWDIPKNQVSGPKNLSEWFSIFQNWFHVILSGRYFLIIFFHYVIIVFCAFLEIPCKIKPEAKSLSHEATHRNIIQGGSLRLLGAVTTANKEFLEKGPSRFFYQVEIKGRAVKYTRSDWLWRKNLFLRLKNLWETLKDWKSPKNNKMNEMENPKCITGSFLREIDISKFRNPKYLFYVLCALCHIKIAKKKSSLLVTKFESPFFFFFW